jgi:hypothetical protein
MKKELTEYSEHRTTTKSSQVESADTGLIWKSVEAMALRLPIQAAFGVIRNTTSNHANTF